MLSFVPMTAEPSPPNEQAPSASPARRAAPADLEPIRSLLARIEDQLDPKQIWLFGSRARGDAGPWSDWDLFVVVPDDTADEKLEPLFLWKLTKGHGPRADVIACRASEFEAARDTVNTLAYVAANEGVRIDDR